MSGDSLWYKDAIFYQLRVRSFRDRNRDGIGDLAGLVEKLPYLQDLGVTALWLLPFYPSPLRDDGYDISDYRAIHPECGSLKDFKSFLKAAHARGLRVITELVLNHTSDQHPWFQRARRAPVGSSHRDFYVWSDTPTRYADTRIIFKDFEPSNWTWDPVASSYYWHRFYSHQPDLNFDNPEVRETMLKVVDHWLGMGVDGLRLDAVPYLFEREGTDCENLPETHAFLRELRSHVDARFPDRMLLAEANQWPEDAAAYFGKGDECHVAFHFPIMPRLFMGIHTEDRFPMLDILEQTPAIPDTCQWALFLRNHDELTLEMVTDEDRDYMWRVYARDPKARINLGIRRRLAPLLDNDRRKIELMNSLLLSLPGSPVLYYGDEIGMGDNVYLGDRNGVRTPMQWSPDRNAGFSGANPQQLILPVIIDPEYHYEAVNVETHHQNPSSLLWWTRRIIGLRKQFRAFGRGTFEPLTPSNRKVLAYVRRHEEEVVLVVANLSRFSQSVDLDLAPFEGRVPTELFGSVEFPPIGPSPYRLSVGPHGFYWFSLEHPRGGPIQPRTGAYEYPSLEVEGRWDHLLRDRRREGLERALPAFLARRRWFRGKARRMRRARIVDSVHMEGTSPPVQMTFVEVEYIEGGPETYVLPLDFRVGEQPGDGTIARLAVRTSAGIERGILAEAIDNPSLPSSLLELAGNWRKKLRGASTDIRGARGGAFRVLSERKEPPSPPRLLGVEQSNTSWILDHCAVLKLYRRVEEGVSLDLEVTRHLTERVGFKGVPALVARVEAGRTGHEPSTLAMAQVYVPNEGDAWRFTLDEIGRYFEEVLPEAERIADLPVLPPILERAVAEPPEPLAGHIGGYLEAARLIGMRTAELHLALATDRGDPAFTPEGFPPMTRRSLYQSVRDRAARTLELLEATMGSVPDPLRPLATEVSGCEPDIVDRLRRLVDRRLGGKRIRCHGDYHLGQLLFTGKDFVVIDFEGEPARSLGERRLKRSPLVDVAGMLRSFHYAAENALASPDGRSALRPEDATRLEPWAAQWYGWVSGAFLRAYLEVEGVASLLPESREDLALLLNVCMIDKALYELGYELNNRPEWVGIPLRGIREVLRSWQSGR